MMPRRVLVVGGGGREHALALRLAQDPSVEVLLAPGSALAAERFPRVLAGAVNNETVAEAAVRHGATLVVVGPEQFLAEGLVDALEERGIPAFGPGRHAARLESSKWFAKSILAARNIPTAKARHCATTGEVDQALEEFAPPFVIKADDLQAGKGVLVTSDVHEAMAFAGRFVGGSEAAGFGDRSILVEEYLAGEEVSIMAVTDGRQFVLLPPARDYKRVEDGDRGPNTGGMGAFAPSPAVDPGLELEIGARIVQPVLDEMASRGTPFRGLLYCGLMLTATGPKVLEFNARFGDPETQVVMPLLGGDFVRLLSSAAAGALDVASFSRNHETCVTIALVDEGYPERSRGGFIAGLEQASAEPGVHVLGAGLERDGDRWRLTGGRAAYVTARAATLREARESAYAVVARLGGQGWKYRTDIAAAPALAARG